MPTRTTMNVSLTPELDRYVKSKVEGGRYHSASEVIRDALRLMEERDEERHLALEELRAKIEEGWQAIEAGDVVDGETVFAEIRERSRLYRASSE